MLWVFDYNGNRGKTALSDMFRNYENFQHFRLANQHTARLIDQSAKGYVFDLHHSAVPTRSFYTLIKQITDGEVWSRSTKKNVQSRKVVVLASGPPNLCALSLDQWQIFHPCLGLINIKCTLSAKRYYCAVSKEMAVNSNSFKELRSEGFKNDRDLFKEYVNLHSSKDDLSTFFANQLAFPKITPCHWNHMCTLLKAAQFGGLRDYVIANGLLEGSIVPADFLDKYVANESEVGSSSSSSGED